MRNLIEKTYCNTKCPYYTTKCELFNRSTAAERRKVMIYAEYKGFKGEIPKSCLKDFMTQDVANSILNKGD